MCEPICSSRFASCGSNRTLQGGGREPLTIFRQINLDKRWTHHDALEFPDGEIMLLTYLIEGQQATVLQLPATAVGSKLPQPLTYVLLPP